MAYLEEFAFKNPKLLMFCLGGHTQNSYIEVHDVVFIVAKTTKEATKKIRKAWFGVDKSLHVDSWFAIESIEGYDVRVIKTKPIHQKNALYFVNLGYYVAAELGEQHFMKLVVAKSKKEAIKSAMDQFSADVEMIHIDDLYDLEGCIHISEVDQYFIQLSYAGSEKKLMQPINGYQNLRY